MSRKNLGNSPAASAVSGIQPGCTRVQPIMHIARTISELGGDPERILAEAGMSADLFANPENAIALQVIGELLERCVAATGREHFGLLLGAGAGDNPLGLLGEILEQCADVGTAIAHFQQYFHVHDRGALATRTIDGKHAHWRPGRSTASTRRSVT